MGKDGKTKQQSEWDDSAPAASGGRKSKQQSEWDDAPASRKSKQQSEWDDAPKGRAKSKQQSEWDDAPKDRAKSKQQSEWDDGAAPKSKQQSEVRMLPPRCQHLRGTFLLSVLLTAALLACLGSGMMRRPRPSSRVHGMMHPNKNRNKPARSALSMLCISCVFFLTDLASRACILARSAQVFFFFAAASQWDSAPKERTKSGGWGKSFRKSGAPCVPSYERSPHLFIARLVVRSIARFTLIPRCQLCRVW